MEREAYVADRSIATALHLAITLGRPLLVEGPAGVGKTEISKVLARALDTELIRLQCYEGLDASTALYEWNYPKQMLRIKLEEGGERTAAEKEASIFSEAYLLRRPLSQAPRPRRLLFHLQLHRPLGLQTPLQSRLDTVPVRLQPFTQQLVLFPGIQQGLII